MHSSSARGWSEAEIRARNASAPIRDAMRFHLVYQGPLSASGNKSKPKEAAAIREALSPQLEELWKTHHALQVLSVEGYEPKHFLGLVRGPGGPFTPKQVFEGDPNSMEDLCAEIPVGAKRYKPLVRKSLSLNCELDILFLRQEDPGGLVNQGGDIDNRIKTLLDGLRMPAVSEQDLAPPSNDMLHCLMESDSLVARLNVDTDRLLFPQSTRANEVHLVIEVSIRVLRVSRANTCLL